MERTRTLLRGFGRSSRPRLDQVLASSLPAPVSVGSTLSSSFGMVWLKREGEASPDLRQSAFASHGGAAKPQPGQIQYSQNFA